MKTARTIEEVHEWYMQDGRKTYAVSAALIGGSLVVIVSPFADWNSLKAFLDEAGKANSFVTLEKRPDFAFEGYSRLEVRW